MRGWGISSNLQSNQGIRGSVNPLSLQANLDFPDSLTTQFNINARNPISSSTAGIAAIAEIISLVNGNSVRRLLSVTNGASITTRGKNITVNVRDYSTVDLGEYQVTILSTHGVRPSIQQPPSLVPLYYNDTNTSEYISGTSHLTGGSGVVLVPAASTVFVPIPDNAGVISAYITAIGSTGAFTAQDLVVRQMAGSVIVRPYALPVDSWVPIAATARMIAIVNATVANDARVNVTFGVDG